MENIEKTEKIPNSNNNFLSYLLILVSFFIVLFFTRNIFADLQVSLDTREQSQQDLALKKETHAKLESIQKTLTESGSLELQKIQGFL